MQISIFKTILIGVLVGLLAFFATKLIVIFLIVGAIFKLSGKGRRKGEQWKSYRLAQADNIRNMSPEDYEDYKSNYGKRHC